MQEEIQSLSDKMIRDLQQIINLIDDLGDEQSELALLHIQRSIFGMCL